MENGPLHSKIQSFVQSIESGPTSLFDRTLTALRSIEENLVALNEKEARGVILGQTESQEFRDLLKLQRDFLLSEHETLSLILHSLITRGEIDYTSDFTKLIQHIRKLDSYSTLLLHYVPSIHAISLLLDPYLSSTPQNIGLPAILNITKEFKEPNDWKLQYWRGFVQFIFYTYATGLHRSKSIDGEIINIDFKADLLDPIKEAIDCGALELLLFVASDINPKTVSFEPFCDFRPELRFYVPEFKYLVKLSPEFLNLIYPSLEKLAEGVITNLADILREMRLNEEDMYLANAQRDLYDTNDDENISGMDLERFFIFIGCLYYDRPDAALPFWIDTESDLYNFVLWASQCDIVFMATAFCSMLASLASGKACAFYVHKFLSEQATNPSFASRTRKIAKLSWNHIFNAISENINSLKPPQPPPSSLLLSKAKVIADIPELDGSEVLILTTYLQVLSQVVKYSPEAREELLSQAGAITVITGTGPESKYTAPPSSSSSISTPGRSSTSSSHMLVSSTPGSLSTALVPAIQPSPSFERKFKPIVPMLFEFLSFYTPLFGPILYTFAGFAQTTSQQTKDNLWLALDQWLFNTTIAFPQNEYLSADIGPKDRIYRLMNSFPTVFGFVTLLETLLRPLPDTQSGLYGLPFPENLGGKYRSPGLWPYVDFIINEVFLTSTTTSSMDKEFQVSLQQPTLLFILHCLRHFDPEIPIISASAGIDTNAIVKAQSFQDYLLVHPSSTAMSFLFSSKIYTPLLGLASIGVDAIADLPDDSPIIAILISSLRIINDVLNLQNIFIDTVKKVGRSGDAGPVHLSTQGLGSFEDAILYNLSVITHLALYSNSANVVLARLSLNLLERISHSSQFSAPSYSTVDSRIRGNRLLSILETVDESVRIKEGFIEQLERPADNYSDATTTSSITPAAADMGMLIKEKILSFLISNLSVNSKEASIAHLILGFKIHSDGSLSLDETRGGILSEISVLQTIINISFSAISAISGSDIPYQPSRIVSLCYKIIRILTKNSISSNLVLDYLREREFFLQGLKTEPIVDLNAQWEGLPFSDSPEFYFSLSSGAIISFVDKRASFFECLSVEIHAAATSGSLSLVSRYIEALVNMNLMQLNSFATSSATRILSFLDVLEYNIPPKSQLDEEIISTFGDQVVNHYLKRESELDDTSAIAELRFLLRLKGLEFVASGHIKSLNDPDFIVAIDAVVQSFTRNRLVERLRSSQLSCLQAWSKLLLVAVNDADMTSSDRTNLILEAFQAVLHKLTLYSSNDAEYAENLASLLVSLYSIYLDDIYNLERRSHISNKSLSLLKKGSADRTHSLFKAAISSILTPISTPALRSELYVIAYKYLKNVLSDESLTATSPIIRNCLQTIRISGDKLIEFVSSDALNGEGTTRLTAYILLEVFSTLSIRANSTFLLDILVKYNMLLLIVQSISHADEEIVKREDSNITFAQSLSSGYKQKRPGSGNNGLTIQKSGMFSAAKRYYELMIFKAIISLLLQLARTRSGAHHVTQCGLFEILKKCKFLRIDPDVGIDVRSAFNPLLIQHSDSRNSTFYMGDGSQDLTSSVSIGSGSSTGGSGFDDKNLKSFSSVLLRNVKTRSGSSGATPGAGSGISVGGNNNKTTSTYTNSLFGGASNLSGGSTGGSNDVTSSTSAVILGVSHHDPQATFYDLVGPTFQLITAILLSLGSENEPVIARVKSFLHSHELLIVALLRKDVLARGKNSTTKDGDVGGTAMSSGSSSIGSSATSSVKSTLSLLDGGSGSIFDRRYSSKTFGSDNVTGTNPISFDGSTSTIGNSAQGSGITGFRGLGDGVGYSINGTINNNGNTSVGSSSISDGITNGIVGTTDNNNTVNGFIKNSIIDNSNNNIDLDGISENRIQQQRAKQTKLISLVNHIILLISLTNYVPT